jgi:preprotein translocase subunit SecD
MPTNTPSGFSDNSIAPDPKYANLPSTSIHKPGYASSTVLLAGLRGACDGATAIRCVLGPAELSSGDIDKATVHQTQTGQWVVDYTMAGSANAALWDKVAQRNFHQMLGIELNGVVYSAPLMQPMQASFSSFDGRGEISGSLTHARAVQLAKQLAEHRSH